MDISIIIPIYKGEKYITYWMEILAKNVTILNQKAKTDCEVVFVNDNPEDFLEIGNITRNFEIKVINNSRNLGIHASRVEGIKNALGKYIVMIDQDDKISENYLLNQYKKIGPNDAIICNGLISGPCLEVKRRIYNKNMPIEKVLSYKNFIEIKNNIISPGQVLIRKNALPKEWLCNIMNMNGADDYFLWLLMHHHKCAFTINDEFLYEHVGHISNVSNDSLGMYASCMEMLEILKREQLIESEDINKLEVGIRNEYRLVTTPSPSEKELKKIQIYDMWLYLRNRDIKIVNYFISHKYKNIIVYGLNGIGNRLLAELHNENVKVVACIDQRAVELAGDLPILDMEDSEIETYINNTDAIVVTAVSFYDEIKEKILEKYQIPVLNIENMIKELVSLANE